jgi:crotonobetainyl-CoA:carnitine CoA-transferase CaiB-like acyl-CoA transferase
MVLPLEVEGFRMLDLTRLVPGQTATWLLADLGMDVLKVEDVADRSS